MDSPITDLAVSTSSAEETRLKNNHFTMMPVDLNKGAGGNFIYLWYKTGCSKAISRLQVTFNDDMAQGLKEAGYTKIDKDLNTGAGADYIYLWYYRGSTEHDTSIVEITATTSENDEPQMFTRGWQRLGCNLNRKTKGNWIYLWVKRAQQTYICDVTATTSYSLDCSNFKDGYIRVDEDTNREANGLYVFIWYRQTVTPKLALTDLKVSTHPTDGWRLVDVNLNEGTRGHPVYLWFKSQGSNKPIKAIGLLFSNFVKAYENAGVTVLKTNLNSGNKGWEEYICVNQ